MHTPKPSSANDQRIIDDVRSPVGFHVVNVGASDPTPPFSYSVGFEESFNAPEVLISCLPPRTAVGLLHVLAGRLKRGWRPADQERLSGLTVRSELEFELRALPIQANHRAGFCSWFYGGADRFRLMQLVWPDARGVLPGEAGGLPDSHLEQELLYVVYLLS